MKDRPSTFDQQLEAALRADDAASDTGVHPDDLTLAAFVDGEVSAAERDRLEAHLASCDSCRELVLMVSEEVPTAKPETSPEAAPARARKSGLGRWLAGVLRFEPPYRPMAVAATLALAVVVGVLVAPYLDDDEPDFGSFVGDRSDMVRGIEPGALDDSPSLLEPSFSVVDVTRPDFRFAFGDDTSVGRLLIVDETETAIGLAEVPVERRGDSLVVAYPDSFPDLRPGGLYAWKIDVRREGAWVPSAFAPFRVGTSAGSAAASGASDEPP